MAKHTHLPFEDWLLSEATLNPEESQALREHLQTCDSCRQLSIAWQNVENQLHKAPTFAPAPGFTARWQARLAEAQLKQKRRQTLFIMLFCVGGTGMLFVILSLLLLPLVESPLPALLDWLYRMTALFASLNTTVDIASTIFSTLFSIVPVTLWIGILVALGSLSALWIVAFQQLTSPRRITL